MSFTSICLLTILHTIKSYDDEKIQLNDGNWIPTTAFGTYIPDVNDRKYIKQAIIWAVEAGYRHIDTAELYLTEDVVGEGLKDVISRGIVKREELFINTKLPINIATIDQVISAIRSSLKRLQLDYLNSCLIHTPRNVLHIKNRDYLEIWKGLEEAKRKGLTRSIGVANFNATEINRILANSETVPAVNQIEVNPTYTDLGLVAYCQSKSIVVTGYAPFGFLVYRPNNNLSIPPTFDNPILVGLAKKYNVDVSQIVLRYPLDRCVIPIAASLDKKHIESNINIYDFTLSKEDVLIINEFDRNTKVYVIDYDGMEKAMRSGFYHLKSYVKKNNLTQYFKDFNLKLD